MAGLFEGGCGWIGWGWGDFVGVVGVDREVSVVNGQLSVRATATAKASATATAKEEADPPAARKDDKIQMGWVNGSIVGTFKPEERQIRGSLHCATHDETVSRFGRDDNLFCKLSVDSSQ